MHKVYGQATSATGSDGALTSGPGRTQITWQVLDDVIFFIAVALLAPHRLLLTVGPDGYVVGLGRVLTEWEVLHIEKVGYEQVPTQSHHQTPKFICMFRIAHRRYSCAHATGAGCARSPAVSELT